MRLRTAVLALLVGVGAAGLSAPPAHAQPAPPGAAVDLQVEIDATASPGEQDFTYVGTPAAVGGLRERLAGRRYAASIALTTCRAGFRYHYALRPVAGGAPVTGYADGCDKLRLTGLPGGKRLLTVTEHNLGRSAYVFSGEVSVASKLVFALGESFAAGEGLPDTGSDGYAFDPCHRSANSTQGRIGRRAAESVPVVFVHLACSAANTSHFYVPQRTQYDPQNVPPQLQVMQQVVDQLGQEPDSVLLGTGGNDVPFLAYLAHCNALPARVPGQNLVSPVFQPPSISPPVVPGFYSACDDRTSSPLARAAGTRLAGELAANIARTRDNLAVVAGCLTAGTSGSVSVGDGSLFGREQIQVPASCPLTTRVAADKVVLVGYPNGFRSDAGACNVPLSGLRVLGPRQSEWLEDRLVGGLETGMAAGAAAAGWRYVSIRAEFDPHGVCARGADRWIFNLDDAITDGIAGVFQGTTGRFGRALHPNARGAAAYAEQAGPVLAEVLTGGRPAVTDQFQRRLVPTCRTTAGERVRGTIQVPDAAVNAGRPLLVRVEPAAGGIADPGDGTSITIQPGVTEYPFDLAAYSEPARIAVYEADVESSQPVLVANAGGSPVDLVFVIDNTGSMDDDIAAVRSAATSIVAGLAAKGLDFRVAVVTYNDPSTSLVLDFSADQGAIVSAVNTVSAGGGDDVPEHVFGGVTQALGLSWRPQASRALVLMGDAEPKDPEPGTGYTTAGVIADAVATRASIYSVLVGGSAPARAAFEALANGTGGSTFAASAATEVVGAVSQALENSTCTPA